MKIDYAENFFSAARDGRTIPPLLLPSRLGWAVLAHWPLVIIGHWSLVVGRWAVHRRCQ
jgi:hypothetical protein